MSYPKTVSVLVEGDDKEVNAVRLHVSARYDAAEYQDDTGRKFFIDREYMDECQSNKKLIRIPLQVISANEKMREKLAWAQEQLFKKAKEQQTGLILPDGLGYQKETSKPV
jgi:hypothetical protein